MPMFSPLQYHTEYFHFSKKPCALPIHPFFLSNLWQSLIFFFTVYIILPFPKCHVIEIIQCVASLTEKAMAPHCTTLAWKIPWTEEPGRLQSMGSYRVGHDWSDLAAAAASLNTIPKAQSMKERTTQLWNRPKTLTDTLSKKIYTRQKSMNICSTSWVTGKCKLK